jgi:hypothetical protein
MPQGLPKKIKVGLLLTHLALKLGDPPPRRLPLMEQRTAQRSAIQRAAARPTRPPQRFKTTSAGLLLPPYSRRRSIFRSDATRHRLTGRHLPTAARFTSPDTFNGGFNSSSLQKLSGVSVSQFGAHYAVSPKRRAPQIGIDGAARAEFAGAADVLGFVEVGRP